jgi:hypothetical protein
VPSIRRVLLVGAIVIATVAATSASVFASVTTDKWLYNAGEIVQITGDGMTAGENVAVEVKYPDGSLAQAHVVVADEAGTFADAYTMLDTDPPGIYEVVATGQTSGAVFTTTFDPNNNVASQTTLSAAPASITIGGSTLLSGALSWTGTPANAAATLSGRTIHLDVFSNASCSSGNKITSLPSQTTNATGAYSYSYTPVSAGTQYVQASWVDEFTVGTTQGGATQDSYKSSTSPCRQLDVNLLTTTLTQTLTPSTISYGQSTAISGTSNLPAGASIAVERHPQTDCGGGATAIGTRTTDAGGNWSSPTLSFRPASPGDVGILANFAGDSTYAAKADCDALTVNKAPTTVVSQVVTPTSTTTAGSALVDYKVQSAYGIAGDKASGTTTIVQTNTTTSGGVLSCTGGGGFGNVTEADANGSGAADAGFGLPVNSGSNATLRFTCTSSTPSTYTFHVHNSGNPNYAASDSGDLTLTIAAADSAAPTLQISFPTPSGTDGWYNGSDTTPVVGSVTATDSTSNVASITCTDSASGLVQGVLSAAGLSRTASLTVSGEGVHDISCTASDVLGNTTPSGSEEQATVKIDTVAPEVSCDAADGDWHADDVDIACTASDDTSDLADAGDASFNLSTSVATGDETADASTDTRDVYDQAGNLSTAGPVTGNQVDKKAPVLSSCDAPDGLWHADEVTLKCHYTDGGSGPATQDVDLTTSVGDGSEDGNASASAGGAQACDEVDNCAASPGDIAGNQVDRKAPTLSSCDAPDGNWHADDVTLKCHYTDGGSGPSTQDVELKTSVSSGSETDDASASAGGAQACDEVDNCADSPDDIAGNKVDKKNPSVRITKPTNTTYTLNQVVAADYECTDGGSGIDTCTGPVADGANIDTSTIGTHTFKVDAKDNVGHTGSTTVTYTVVFDFTGFFQPIDMGSTFNTAKAGSAIPVKFSLHGNQGLNILTSGYPTSKVIECTADPTDALETLVATAGNSSLSYDATTDQYVYVWKTDKSWTNATACRQLVVKLADGTLHFAKFKFTK